MNRLSLREVHKLGHCHEPEKMGQKLPMEFSSLGFDRQLEKISQGRSDLEALFGKTSAGLFEKTLPTNASRAGVTRHHTTSCTSPNCWNVGRIVQINHIARDGFDVLLSMFARRYDSAPTTPTMSPESGNSTSKPARCSCSRSRSKIPLRTSGDPTCPLEY